MELREIIPLSLSGLSLVISLTALYASHFRRPKLSVVLGPDIHMYYNHRQSASFYLPVVFQNFSSGRGHVQHIRISIKDPSGNYFLMDWWDSTRILYSKMEYEFVDRAQPKKIDGFDSSADVLGFFHPKMDGIIPLDFIAGRYEVCVFVWTKVSGKPSIRKKAKFSLSDEGARTLANHRQSGETNTWYVYLEGTGSISRALGKTPPDSTELNLRHD